MRDRSHSFHCSRFLVFESSIVVNWSSIRSPTLSHVTFVRRIVISILSRIHTISKPSPLMSRPFHVPSYGLTPPHPPTNLRRSLPQNQLHFTFASPPRGYSRCLIDPRNSSLIHVMRGGAEIKAKKKAHHPPSPPTRLGSRAVTYRHVSACGPMSHRAGTLDEIDRDDHMWTEV